MDISRAKLLCLLVLGLLFVGGGNSASLSGADFQQCQRQYSQLIGDLVASEGTSAVSTLWRLVFNKLDLNGNGRIGAAEFVISLETAELLKQVETREAYSVVHTLIYEGAATGERDLDEQEFKDVMSSAIGRSHNREAYTSICKYLTSEAAGIVSSMKAFTKSSEEIKSVLAGLLSDSKSATQLLANVWEGIFASMDLDSNEHISMEELVSLHERYVNQDDVTEKLAEITEVLVRSSEASVLSKTDFYFNVKSLLYEMDTFIDHITTTSQLESVTTFTEILFRVVEDFSSKFTENLKYKREYERALDSNLAADKSVAAEVLFALFDNNKDGEVDFSEIGAVVSTFASPSRGFDFSFALVARDNIRSLNVAEFSSFLPDQVVDVRTSSNDTQFELSRLSIEQQRTWRAFCGATHGSLLQFPFARATFHSASVELVESIDVLIESSEDSFAEADDSYLMQLEEKIRNVLVRRKTEESGGETSEAGSEAPEVETEAPEVVTEAPKVVTETPEVETEAPKVETEAPEVETEAPEVETETPEVETETPEVETEAPEAETPEAETEAPKVVTETPEVVTEALEAETETPEAVTESPETPEALTEPSEASTVLEPTEKSEAPETSEAKEAETEAPKATTVTEAGANENRDSEEPATNTDAAADSPVSSEETTETTTTTTNIDQVTTDVLESELAGLVKNIIADMKEGKHVGEEQRAEAEQAAVKIDKETDDGKRLEGELDELFNVDDGKTASKSNLSKEERELLELIDGQRSLE